MCFLKTWKKFRKPGKCFEKTSGNPVSSFTVSFQCCYAIQDFFISLC